MWLIIPHVIHPANFASSLKICYGDFLGFIRGDWSSVAKKSSWYRGTNEIKFYFSLMLIVQLGRWSGDNSRIFSPEGQPGTLVGVLALSLQIFPFLIQGSWCSGHNFPAREQIGKFRASCLPKKDNHKVTCIIFAHVLLDRAQLYGHTYLQKKVRILAF